jgi:hypothetical protein
MATSGLSADRNARYVTVVLSPSLLRMTTRTEAELTATAAIVRVVCVPA